MRALKWFIGILAGILLPLFLIGFLLPSEHEAETSLLIDAPTSQFFDQVTDFRNLVEWHQDFADREEVEYEFPGESAGVGAELHYHVNGQGGVWRIENVEEDAFVLMRTVGRDATDFHFDQVDLDEGFRVFVGVRPPLESRFDFAPERGGTRVTWRVTADFGNNIPGRYLGLFLDEVLGSDMRSGLLNLRHIVESQPPTPFEDDD